MKFKNCQVKLVSENRNDLVKWIDEIKKDVFFKKVVASEIYQCEFDIDNKKVIDFRVVVYFVSKASKNNIYFSMNQIKATPIKFY